MRDRTGGRVLHESSDECCVCHLFDARNFRTNNQRHMAEYQMATNKTITVLSLSSERVSLTERTKAIRQVGHVHYLKQEIVRPTE